MSSADADDMCDLRFVICDWVRDGRFVALKSRVANRQSKNGEWPMGKHGKKYTAAATAVGERQYSIEDAIPLIQKVKYAKFDETVEVTLRLGVDPKHADQMVRGTVVLPHGLGKSKKVLVIATGEKQREAEAAGADIVGGEERVEKIQKEDLTDFDALNATADTMKSVG